MSHNHLKYQRRSEMSVFDDSYDLGEMWVKGIWIIILSMFGIPIYLFFLMFGKDKR